MLSTKGGLIGITYNDFTKRQKSGNWNINEHYQNKNYIRDSNIPYQYLALGCYDESEIVVYDIFFNNKLSTNLFRLNGIVHCIDFNYEKNLLAFGLSEPPYLRIIDTSDFTEKQIPYSISKPINCVKFNYLGDKLYVSYITDAKPYLSLFDTTTFLSLTDEPSGYSFSDLPSGLSLTELPSSTLIDLLSSGGDLPDLAAYQIEKQITNINISNNNLYLAISHYDTNNNSDTTYTHNLSLFKLNTYSNEYTLDQNINYILNSNLNTGTITSSVFLEDYNYLVLGHYRYPYITFYDYNNQQVLSEHKLSLSSKVNCLSRTEDNNLLLIGVDKPPYLYLYNVLDKVLTPSGLNIFSSPISSISLSLNDKFLLVSQINTNNNIINKQNTFLFDFSKRNLSNKLTLSNYYPSTTVLTSTFFFGPQVEYSTFQKELYSISINKNSIGIIDKFNTSHIVGSFISPVSYSNVHSITLYDDDLVTAIKLDGTLLSNDPNIDITKFNNIISLSSYYNRIAFLDVFDSVILPKNNNFTIDEQLYISNNMSKDILQISVGYSTLLALTTSNTVLSSNQSLFNPNDYTLPPIKQVSAGHSHVSLLTTSNTVLSYGSNLYNQCETSSWENIQQISCGEFHTIGLTTLNTVVYTGDTLLFDIVSLLQETNVIYIASGPSIIVLLKSDGTIVSYPKLQFDFSNINLTPDY